MIRVDPSTGDQTTVSADGSFSNPAGVAVEADGAILVADLDPVGGPGEVIRVDPATGAQTTVSAGGSFVSPVGIAVVPPATDSDGDGVGDDEDNCRPLTGPSRCPRARRLPDDPHQRT